MAPWFWYAVVAAILYGAHQIFTRLASQQIGDGLGGFVVESIAALSILCYLAFLYFSGRWNQKFTSEGSSFSSQYRSSPCQNLRPKKGKAGWKVTSSQLKLSRRSD